MNQFNSDVAVALNTQNLFPFPHPVLVKLNSVEDTTTHIKYRSDLEDYYTEGVAEVWRYPDFCAAFVKVIPRRTPSLAVNQALESKDLGMITEGTPVTQYIELVKPGWTKTVGPLLLISLPQAHQDYELGPGYSTLLVRIRTSGSLTFDEDPVFRLGIGTERRKPLSGSLLADCVTDFFTLTEKSEIKCRLVFRNTGTQNLRIPSNTELGYCYKMLPSDVKCFNTMQVCTAKVNLLNCNKCYISLRNTSFSWKTSLE